jgi:small basic protein
MKFSEEDFPLPRPERPLGVTILTMWDGLIFGVIPILGTVFGVLQTGLDRVLPITIYLSAGLSALIISAAIGTYLGNDRARSALIYILTLYQSLQAYSNVILIASGTLQPADLLFAMGRILGAVFWIALHAWYFLRPQTLEFYRRKKTKPDQIQSRSK